MIIKRTYADAPHKPLPDGQAGTLQLYLSRFETDVPNLQEISVLHILEKGSIDGQGLQGLAVGTSKHEFIQARTNRVGIHIDRLAKHVGTEQANTISCQAYIHVMDGA